MAGVARAAGLSWSATRRALDTLSAAGAIRRVESTQSWHLINNAPARRSTRRHESEIGGFV